MVNIDLSKIDSNGCVLDTYTFDSYVSGRTHYWEKVQLKVEAIPDSKLHFLPREQCPSCGDIGQHTYSDPDGKHKYIFYCPFCHVHYFVRYYSEGEEVS